MQLREHCAEEVLGVGEDASTTMPELFSKSRRASPNGLLVAYAVLVPLEDDGGTEALKASR
jgi:4-phosphopantoate--beta-alanine ligase